MKKIVLTVILALAMGGSVSAQSAVSAKGPAWLGNAVFYQIYPSSYMDTDGNGASVGLNYLNGIGRCGHGKGTFR